MPRIIAQGSVEDLDWVHQYLYNIHSEPDEDPDKVRQYLNGLHFAQGGLVDFTGPAWVDGTPSRPEAFLSAEDTAMIRSWLDSARYVRMRPFMSNIDSSSFGGNNTTIGDVNITITEASFKEDADYEKVAERVGEVFVKELEKQGFMSSNYAF